MAGIKGYTFITSTGHDPEKGKSIKDPYLGNTPSLGACRPDIRRQVVPGDYIFVVSGKVFNTNQFVIGGFEVAQKIPATMAYKLFPEQRLHQLSDGQLAGNVIVNAYGGQHSLDQHKASTFEQRIENYVIGRNPIALTTPEEIARGREETLYVLKTILGKKGDSALKILGRGGSKLDHLQILELREWLISLKSSSLAMNA